MARSRYVNEGVLFSKLSVIENTQNFLLELTVLGDLKLEGPLMENSKPRVVLLFQTMLIITKKKEDNRLQYKNFIHVRNIRCRN